MIDLLANLLPESPGGPSRADGATAAARVAAEHGTTMLVCAPDVDGPLGKALDERDQGVAALRAQVGDAGIELAILPGAVLTLDQLGRATDDELERASIGSNGRWVAVRLPERGWPLRLTDIMDGLEVRDFGIVLVEPERCDSVQRSPDRLRDLVGRGALVMIGTRSLMSEHGPRVRWTAANLLRGAVVHLIGSGGGADDNPPRLDDGLAEVEIILRRPPEQLAWFVDGGPSAVLAGGAVRPPKITQHRGRRADGPQGPDGPPRPFGG